MSPIYRLEKQGWTLNELARVTPTYEVRHKATIRTGIPHWQFGKPLSTSGYFFISVTQIILVVCPIQGKHDA